MLCHFPDGSWVRFKRTQWVCKWGSSSLLVSWWNWAATKFPVFIGWRRPSFSVTLVNAYRASRIKSVFCTALRCASSNLRSPLTRDNRLTLFGALKVQSFPALSLWFLFLGWPRNFSPLGSAPKTRFLKSSSLIFPHSFNCLAPWPYHWEFSCCSSSE